MCAQPVVTGSALIVHQEAAILVEVHVLLVTITKIRSLQFVKAAIMDIMRVEVAVYSVQIAVKHALGRNHVVLAHKDIT